MGRMRFTYVLMGLLALGACDSNNEPEDAGTDTGTADAGPAVQAIPGLDGPVEVIVDDRGMPHIYATTRHDLMVVQGYLMSRDRFIQMEFIRRGVVGRVAEVLATVDPSVIEGDRGARFLGFERQGQAIYDSLAADDATRLAVEAFVDGINHYIDTVIADEEYLTPDGLVLFAIIRGSENFGHWHPRDIFALGRYQAWNLAYDAGADVSRTQRLMGVQAAFGAADPVGEPLLAARAGIYADFFSEVQARDVYTRDGFNDGTTMAFLPSVSEPLPPRFGSALTRGAVEGGARFFERLDRNPLFHRDEHVGSNSWVVHGDHTASGNAILSNDPHLSLISPAVWWYVHLNTAEMGGEDDIDVQGVAFAGLPGVVLGYNRDLAWSATTTGYDVTDVYAEEVTFRNDGDAAAPSWVPVSVRFEGADVPFETIEEEILVARSAAETYAILVVPHHGPIIPDSLVEPVVVDPPTGAMEVGSGLSVRYTGHETSNELGFFTGLMTATSVTEALAAQDIFMVGAQNFSFASRSGDIAWSTRARIPVRDAAACSFDVGADGTITGLSPLFILPGTGGYEWGGDLGDEFIPHDMNPARGYIATANQDNVGVTRDGNVCNDGHYIGGGFAVGFRMGRIVERLDTATTAGGITPDDMMTLQAETRSSLGETMRAPIVASLAHALGDTSDDDALDALVGTIDAEDLVALADVRDRLVAWSLETPHGVGATDAGEVADSVATTLFNVTLTRIAHLAFDDEEARIGSGMSSHYTARMLEWVLADAPAQEALPLHTYRADYGGVTGWNDSVVWDDLDTAAVVESRDERVTSAVLDALAWLEGELGADRDSWRWGRLHAVRFGQIVPSTSGTEIVSIPPGDSEEFPLGFPRHGDYGAVDVGNFSMTNGTRFTHGSGASQRLVVEMTADGPQPFNSLPGGQNEDVASPHHADEAELWRANEQPPLYFQRADVETHAEETLLFSPGA